MTAAPTIVVRVDRGGSTAWARAVTERLERAGRNVAAVVEAPRPPAPGPVARFVAALDDALLALPPDPDAPAQLDLPRRSEVGDADLVVDLSAGGLPVPAAAECWRVLVDGAPAVERATYLPLLSASRRTCEVTVEARTGDGRTRVLAHAVSAVDPVSVARTRSPILWKAVEMLGRAAEGRIPVDGSAAVAGATRPSTAGSAAWAPRAVARVARRRLRKLLGRDEWFLAVRPAVDVPARAHDVAARLAATRLSPLAQPPGVSRADPFLLERDGRTYLFCEELRGSPHGYIAVGVLEHGELRAELAPCLVRPHHLSYPFVFVHDGVTYMLPESSATQSVELYRATTFPHGWTHDRTLLSGVAAVDPTLLRHDGRWWLFVGTFAPGASPSEELSLFHAERLDAEWVAHPANPVVADVRCARPAGPLFRAGDDLLRPAQDGSRGYGSAIVLRRVLALTPDEYREESIGTLSPAWLEGAHATHTYARGGGFEATDGQRYARRSWRR